jgi:NADP-dependent 3-hydroxy acid dehydrogenase YdfG
MASRLKDKWVLITGASARPRRSPFSQKAQTLIGARRVDRLAQVAAGLKAGAPVAHPSWT